MEHENILNGPPALPVKDLKKPLGEFLLERLTANGKAVAQVDAVTGVARTYDEIREYSLKLAEGMRYGRPETNRFHLAAGDGVGICSENSIDFIIPVLSTLYLGGCVAPVNPVYTKNELVHTLSISKPKVVFASKLTLKNVLEAASVLEFVKMVVVMDEIRSGRLENDASSLSSDRVLVRSMSDLLHPEEPFVPSIPLERDLPKVNPSEDVAFILCSSGTTGLPKGVMLTHLNITVCIEQLEDERTLGISQLRVSLAILPFFHGFGLINLLRMTALGLKVVVMNRFEPQVFFRAIQEHKVSTLSLVPPLLVFLTKEPRVDKYDLSSISQILCGAAPLGRDTEERVEAIINKQRSRIGAPPCTVRQGYGLTETTLAVMLSPEVGKKPGSAGILNPGIQCKVCDLETGKALGPFKEGELCFRSALTMKGYKDNPDATSNMIDKDGWLHSGDIGYYDNDKHFFIVDRLKELIKYKGFQRMCLLRSNSVVGYYLWNPFQRRLVVRY
ncbi:luciferin 4-monooxygenase-like isoform X2 [Ischnura elegans]|uniref:luciferin 4-monooxygenase-like isoform X2 n=1 Tax=Ischnura elegans TaxID=197161 RepID=UPI001ED891D6|nr:luciferin 4-monooxygenase-like isoform X2 [Ischnura elegans]